MSAWLLGVWELCRSLIFLIDFIILFMIRNNFHYKNSNIVKLVYGINMFLCLAYGFLLPCIYFHVLFFVFHIFSYFSYFVLFLSYCLSFRYTAYWFSAFVRLYSMIGYKIRGIIPSAIQYILVAYLLCM